MPISNSGPIRVSDILTVKGFRNATIPSTQFTQSDTVYGSRTPSTPVSFSYLFEQNRKTGPNATRPHSLSEFRGVGNEVSTAPTGITATGSGDTVTATWTNTDPDAYTVLQIYRREGFVVDPEPTQVGTYALVGQIQVAPGVTTYAFSGLTAGGRFKVAIMHAWINAFPDSGSGWQSAYVFSNNVLITPSGVTPIETGSRYSTTMVCRLYDDVGELYRGFQSANRCSEAATAEVTVYYDTPDFEPGITLYAANTGSGTINAAATGPGSGPYYRVQVGSVFRSFSINGSRVVQNDFITCT